MEVKTLYSVFEKSALSFPMNIAITFNSGPIQQHSTYQEVDKQASRIADYLGSRFDKQNVIAVYAKQSTELVACLLGILKHGSCFAPISLNWPPGVVCRFLSKLSVSEILVDKTLVENLQKRMTEWDRNQPSHGCKFEFIANEAVHVNGFTLLRKQPSISVEAEKINSLDLAYIMQSSGTTGEPKAVKVPHCCIVPNIADIG